MKTASFLILLLALPVSAAYSQSGASASADAAAQAQGSVQKVGRDQGASATQATSTGATAATSGKSLSGAAGESSAAAGQLGKTSAGATQASNLSAELTQKIDSKNAKVGDQVIAKTTSTTQLAEGTKLPKGTRLMGKVTDVQAKSGAQHDGHLAFAFDRAVLRDGREIPIHATLQSISAPVTASAMGSGADDFAASAGPVAGAGPVMASGGGSARGGGGLLGGGGVAVPQTGGLISGATSSVGNTAGRATSTTGQALHETTNTGRGLVSQTAGAGVATVHNMPGVTATGSASGASSLDAKGKNVELGTGTQMMFTVSSN